LLKHASAEAVSTEDQTPVINFLAQPSTHGGVPVDRIDTHISCVFLAGTRAWKLKRAVRFDYLDSSTAARRKALCEAEVRLNRRTAPTIYRGVAAITREPDGSLALGGPGLPVDWVVEMHRFDQEALFDRLAASDRLGLPLMIALAREIAQFHRAAEPRRDHSGKSGMGWVIDGNAAGFAEYGAQILNQAACGRLTAAARAELERSGSLLDARREAGLVRQCHGDLHLRNIVLLEGKPTLFDAIEFNDEIACGDVLYELAFLLMDLWRRRLSHHANVVWNSYLAETDDLDGVSLMPLFLSCRAAVRAKTSATAAGMQSKTARAAELGQLARDYLMMAAALLQPELPRLIAIGGRSGTGKSTLAQALAPSVGAVPGGVVLRSDEARKRLCGATMSEHLGLEGYSSDITERVYVTMAQRADVILRGGHSAIVDAVYAKPEHRELIRRIAADASVPFAGFWLDAPDSVLLERVRRRTDDVSDADVDVVRRQRVQEIGIVDWHHVDASSSAETVLEEATAVMGACRGATSSI
jgi:aminoglycoside phosphotransferase family enzyme/predicted kinase